MCSQSDHPPYDPEPTVAQVAALAQAICGGDEPGVFIVEQAELVALRLAVRGWVLVNRDEDGGEA
jgi:hypothetical protein